MRDMNAEEYHAKLHASWVTRQRSGTTMDRMARPLRLTALASLLATLACANTPEPGGGPTASSHTDPSVATPDTAEPAQPGTERPDQLATTVPVASAPTDARPCERMCGRVGDCLRERGDPNNAGHLRDAGYLELSCLDLCVNVEPSSDAGKRFRACESRDGCDQLLECTRKDWDATAAARGTVVLQIDATPANYGTCELVCGGMYSCVHHDQPLHQLQDRSEQFERDLRACMTSCDPRSEAMVAFAECAQEPTCVAQWECWERVQSY